MNIIAVNVTPLDQSIVEKYSVSIDPVTVQEPVSPAVLNFAESVIQGIKEKAA